MHEVALRKQMNHTMAQFKKDPIPHGAGVRKMTAEEVDNYTHDSMVTYSNCQMTDNLVIDGKVMDKDPSVGKIDIRYQGTTNWDNNKVKHKESLKGTYGGRSKAYEFVYDKADTQVATGERHSETTMAAGANNIGHVTGLLMERKDDSLSVTQFYVDRLNPTNSLIFIQEPSTAKEMPAFLSH